MTDALAHDFTFDPTYGYSLEELLAIHPPEPPEHFASFWQDTHDETREIRLDLEVRPSALRHERYEILDVSFFSLDGVRIGGWVTIPRDGCRRDLATVVGHGYGGRLGPDFDLPLPPSPALFVCLRGFNRSGHARIPNLAGAHVLHGIEDRETYVHRGCAADVWCAATALGELFAGSQLRYWGGSFGGGIGALALPWDERFARTFFDVPSFGHHPLRVQMECLGSGEAVRTRLRERPEILKVLRYFDAATAATFLKIPTFVAAALFDPAVPPPGQFAVYNALAGERKLFVRRSGHFTGPHEAAENVALDAELREWFGSAARMAR